MLTFEHILGSSLQVGVDERMIGASKSGLLRNATLLGRNTDVVKILGYWSLASGVAYFATGVASPRQIITTHWKQRCRQSSTNLERIQFHVNTLADLTNVKFQVWRKAGATYALVKEEGILPQLIVGVNDVSLSPVSTIEGDYYCIAMEFVGDQVVLDGVNFGVTASRYTTGEELTSPADFDSKTADNYIQPLFGYGRAPLIVWTGDSIIGSYGGFTSNVEPTDVTKSIPYKARRLNDALIYQNMGHASEQTTAIKNRFAADVVDLKPRYAVIEGGVNDLASGSTKATYLSNMETMISAALGAGIRTIVCEIMPWTNGSNAQMQSRDEWTADLRALVAASYPSVELIDFDTELGAYRAGGDVGNLWNIKPGYSLDGIHFLENANAVIAQTVYDRLVRMP